MKKRILELLLELEPLVKKEAEKEKNREPKVFTEFHKEIKFFKEEIEGLAKEET
jgi:hypothetical protein